MAEITKSEDVIKKIQEFDNYLSQIKDILSSLREIREDAKKENHALLQKREELTSFENDLLALKEKALAFSQKTEELLLPIRKEKEELEVFQTKIENRIGETRKELDSKMADFLYKQNALVSNLSQQIDSYQRLTESLKSNLGSQNQQIKHLETENSELRNIIESIKQLLEKQRQDFSTDLDELREKHIEKLENENTEMKSELNALTTKFNNIKFKKLLGL